MSTPASEYDNYFVVFFIVYIVFYMVIFFAYFFLFIALFIFIICYAIARNNNIDTIGHFGTNFRTGRRTNYWNNHEINRATIESSIVKPSTIESSTVNH